MRKIKDNGRTLKFIPDGYINYFGMVKHWRETIPSRIARFIKKMANR